MSEVKFPPRVTECFSMGGLRVDYFRNDSPAFEATQGVDRGREYLSLQEHNHLISQLEERLRVAKDAIIKFRKHFASCSDAGFSNMEGADADEFLYWQKWHLENHALLVDANTTLAAIKEKK